MRRSSAQGCVALVRAAVAPVKPHGNAVNRLFRARPSDAAKSAGLAIYQPGRRIRNAAAVSQAASLRRKRANMDRSDAGCPARPGFGQIYAPTAVIFAGA